LTNVLILAANEPHDDRDSGYPLCLTEVNGIPLIQHLIEKCNAVPGVNIILAVREEDVKKWHLDNVIRLLSPTATIIQVQQKTAGAACTALLAISHINTDDPLLILNGNELIDVDYDAVLTEFANAEYDAGVVVFPSVHPRYSYVRINAQREVVEAAEKNPISNHATVGFYWFRKGRSFIHAAQQTILKGSHVGGQYYICPTMNELVLKQARIGIHPIESQKYHPLKSERQIERFGALLDTGRE
jgi:dTDP-glucose pyrophosphorylase